MVCNLIDFVLVVFKLLMFIVCEITVISKIKVFNFSSTETKLNKVKNKKVKQNKKIKNNSKPPKIFKSITFQITLTNSEYIYIFFWFFTKNFHSFAPCTHCVGAIIELSSDSNTSNTVRVNIVFTICRYAG